MQKVLSRMIQGRAACCTLSAAMFIGLAGCQITPVQEAAEIQMQAVLPHLHLAAGRDPWGGSVLHNKAGCHVAAAMHGDNALALWRLDGTLATPVAEVATGYHPDDVAVWDSSHFVVSVEGESKLQLWHFDGEGLALKAEHPTPFPAIGVRVADLDGDGLQDVVLSPYGGDRIAVLWGLGQGAGFDFTPPDFLQAAFTPWYPVLHDWTGNGHADLLWAETDSGVIRLHENLGGREFRMSVLHEAPTSIMRQLAIGDIDRDGREDLVVSVEVGAHSTMGHGLVLFNRPSGLQAEYIPAPVWGFRGAAVLADGTVALGERDRIVLAQHTSAGWDYRQLPAGRLPAPQFVLDADCNGVEDLFVLDPAHGGIHIHFGPVWDRGQPFND
jgi:hypothetical protein